jgi:Xaa-Pro dipeptidase
MLHFTRDELAGRRDAICRELARRGLDALLMFRQESMYYLTGYDTFGYVFFQCLCVRADGDLVLLTRKPDREQARLTSVVDDVRVWADGADANPAAALKDILAENGLANARLGVELDAYGLTARNYRRLADALDGFAELRDASDLVSRLRLVKSSAEIAYVRRAAELADDALDEAHRLASPGADEGEILAAMQGAVFRGGGDYPGNPFIIGSGDHALLVRYASGRRKLNNPDQLTIEFAGAYRHYHACLMRTVPIGEASALHRRFHAVATDAMGAVVDAFRVGNSVGDAYAAHARVFDEAGLTDARMNACGYSLGTTFAPNWMDVPMIYAGEPTIIEPGMVFFLHMILADRETGTAMCPGQTILTGESGAAVLSRHGLDLVVR